MILLLLSMLPLMAILVYVIHFFNNSLENRSENYYEMKEYNQLVHTKKKGGMGFLNRIIRTH